MNWIKMHLNITWTVLVLLRFAVIPLGWLAPYLITEVLWILGTFWVLHQKGRSLWWFIFPVAVLFLANKRTEDPQNGKHPSTG